MLFEVAILELPTKKEAEEGKVERLVFGPKPVVANDAQSAAIAAVLGEEKIEIDRDRMQVLVRPFADQAVIKLQTATQAIAQGSALLLASLEAYRQSSVERDKWVVERDKWVVEQLGEKEPPSVSLGNDTTVQYLNAQTHGFTYKFETFLGQERKGGRYHSRLRLC